MSCLGVKNLTQKSVEKKEGLKSGNQRKGGEQKWQLEGG